MTVDFRQPIPAPGEPDKGLLEVSDVELAEYIERALTHGYVKSAARATAELDRRLNRS